MTKIDWGMMGVEDVFKDVTLDNPKKKGIATIRRVAISEEKPLMLGQFGEVAEHKFNY